VTLLIRSVTEVLAGFGDYVSHVAQWISDAVPGGD
jgi:hypothetical protein